MKNIFYSPYNMLTLEGLLLGIMMIILPGFLILFLGEKYFKSFCELNELDKFIASIVLSGLFNFSFFLFRLTPGPRTTLYLIGIILLIAFSIHKAKKESETPLKKILNNSKSAIHKSLFAILVIVLGILVMADPLNDLILSRSALNPNGGDVQFTLFKSHLLRAGYSVFDDLYPDQFPTHPQFPTVQVALLTLLTGGGMALNAETFRLVLVVVYFFMFYAIGRGLTLNKLESLFLAFAILSAGRIAFHSQEFILAGMSFMATLLFLYFIIRAMDSQKSGLWMFAGMGAWLSVHSHAAHAAFTGLISAMGLILFLIQNQFQRKNVKEFFKTTYLFFLWSLGGVALYIGPLILKYQLKVTNSYNFNQPMENTVSERINQILFNNDFVLPAMGITFILAILFIFKLKRKQSSSFSGLTYLGLAFIMILSAVLVLQAWGIHRGITGLYIDSNDFIDFVHGMSIGLVVLFVFRLIEKTIQKWNYSFQAMATLRSLGILLFFILLLPNNPILDTTSKQSYWQYWKNRGLARYEGERALEGNIDHSNWDFHAQEIHKVIPPFSSAILYSPSNAALVGNLARQVILFDEPYSNFFLDPPQQERKKDAESFFKNPRESTLGLLVKRYGLTHILWDGRDSKEVYQFLEQSSKVKKIAEPTWIGSVWEIQANAF